MPYRKLEARIHNRAVMETKNDENAPQATYKMCMDTARTLGQGTLVHIQGRLHSIDPGTTLRISAYTGCLCSGEEPSISGRLVKLSTPTASNQDYIDITAAGPYHLWTEGTLQSGVELVHTIIRTAIDAPWVRRLENSSCACVHIP